MSATGAVTQQDANNASVPITATLQGQTQTGVMGFKLESGLWCYASLGDS
jgi:hypothetical protein